MKIFRLQLATAVQPVNRYFSAANSRPQPDLECLVGIDSKDVSELYKVGKLSEIFCSNFLTKIFGLQVKCTEAWNISIKYERATANTWATAKYISEHDRRLRTLK